MSRIYTASEMKIAHEMSLIFATRNEAVDEALFKQVQHNAIERYVSLYKRNSEQYRARIVANALKAERELRLAHIERKRKHKQALIERELMKAALNV